MPQNEDEIKQTLESSVLQRGGSPGFLTGHDKLLLGSSLAFLPFTGISGGVGAALGGLAGARLHNAYPKSIAASAAIAPLLGMIAGGLIGKSVGDRRAKKHELVRRYKYNLPE